MDNGAKSLHAAVVEVLAACDAARSRGLRIDEGGERIFRGWLAMRVLNRDLGWPWDAIIFGESFDLLLLDHLRMPAVYIETKTPDSRLSAKHQAEVAARIHRWGSLRDAWLVNGYEWRAYRIDPGPELVGERACVIPGNVAEVDRLIGELHARRYGH